LRVRLPSPVTTRSRSSPKLSRICRIGLQLGCLDNQIFPITHNAIEFAPQAIKRRTEEAGKVARRLTRLICRDRDFAHKLPVLNPLTISAIQSLRPRLDLNSRPLTNPPNFQHKTQLPPPNTQASIILHREPHRVAFRLTRQQIIRIRQRAVGELRVAACHLARHI
jgi:hypothetical protein